MNQNQKDQIANITKRLNHNLARRDSLTKQLRKWRELSHDPAARTEAMVTQQHLTCADGAITEDRLKLIDVQAEAIALFEKQYQPCFIIKEVDGDSAFYTISENTVSFTRNIMKATILKDKASAIDVAKHEKANGFGKLTVMPVADFYRNRSMVLTLGNKKDALVAK